MAPTNAVWIDRPHGPAVLKSSRFSEHPAFSYNENKDRIEHRRKEHPCNQRLLCRAHASTPGAGQPSDGSGKTTSDLLIYVGDL
jgi:hypothetical protein